MSTSAYSLRRISEEPSLATTRVAPQRVLAAFSSALESLDGELDPDAFKALAKQAGQDSGCKGKDLFFPLRAAITGRVHGPDLARTASVKGRDVVARLLVRASA